MSSDFDEDLLLSYSDDELSRITDNSPTLAPDIQVLSPKLVAKLVVPPVLDDAVKAMEVAHALGIRVPSTRRTIKTDSVAYCIMDFIEGVALDEAWPRLSWFTTIRLAFQLRGFIRKLRSITSQCAGSLVSEECKSLWLDDKFHIPNRSAPSNITAFFTFWVDFTSMRKAIANASSPVPSTAWIPATAEKLVLITTLLLETSYSITTTRFGWSTGTLLGSIQNISSTHQCINSSSQKAGTGLHGYGGGCFHGFQLGTTRKKNTYWE